MNHSPAMRRWMQISRRIRVPLGFAFVVLYFWLARPSELSILLSLVLVLPGIWLRGYASGYVKKNSELTTTGPYAHTRNPLYLGSILIAFGFALAARSLLIAVALVACFLAIYWPVILSEEEFLRTHFFGFEKYAERVPRLMPGFRGVKDDVPGAFSWQLYREHREYNSLLGSVCLYAALTALLWIRNGR